MKTRSIEGEMLCVVCFGHSTCAAMVEEIDLTDHRVRVLNPSGLNTAGIETVLLDRGQAITIGITLIQLDSVKLGNAKHQRARGAAMQLANNQDLKMIQTAQALTYGEEIDQRLRRMLGTCTYTVTSIDHRHRCEFSEDAGRTHVRMPQDHSIAIAAYHPCHVSQRLSAAVLGCIRTALTNT